MNDYKGDPRAYSIITCMSDSIKGSARAKVHTEHIGSGVIDPSSLINELLTRVLPSKRRFFFAPEYTSQIQHKPKVGLKRFRICALVATVANPLGFLEALGENK